MYMGAQPASAHMVSTSRQEPLCTRCVATWNASSSHVKMLQKVCGLRSILSATEMVRMQPRLGDIVAYSGKNED